MPDNVQLKDREHFRIPAKVFATSVLGGIILTAGVAYLFYRSVWAMGLGVVLVPLYVVKRSRRWQKNRCDKLQEQFVSGLQMISGSLTAGYSMENAWRKAEKELISLYGEDAVFCLEMKKMTQKLDLHEPLEQILAAFAAESGVEEVWYFSEIFSYAKRSGGNINEIIRSCQKRIRQRAEVFSEIEAAVAAKKMEQRMMNLLLPAILLFVTVSSPSYVSVLYHNLLGVVVMSVCLAGYFGCAFWSERITDIAV